MGKFDGGVADLQDRVFKKIQDSSEITDKDYKDIQNNIWIDYAYRLAPSNLVVRHLCLRDFLSGTSNNDWRIWSQLRYLTSGDKAPLWMEGYSYWLYTKPFLLEYVTRFPAPTACIKYIVEKIDESFALSGYDRDGVHYPAPFGDLSDIPLEGHLQNITPVLDFKCSYLTKTAGNIYYVKKSYLGFNAHVPSKDETYIIKNGIPYLNGNPTREFEWYEGWDKKYPTIWDELKVYINVQRIRSAFFQRYR